MHLLKTEEEKRTATNRRILTEFSFLWALQETWDLATAEIYVHKLRGDAGECYNLETVFHWEERQFPVKVWLYFTGPTTLKLMELSTSGTTRYWQSALSEELERYRSGMQLATCVVFNYSPWPGKIDIYRFPKDREFFLWLMGKAQMHK